MTENAANTPVVYEEQNRELRTVIDYFAQREDAVLDIEWQNQTHVGDPITAGQLLAHIVWDGRPNEPLYAPLGCTGNIVWKNGRVEYERLHRRSEVLLRL